MPSIESENQPEAVSGAGDGERDGNVVGLEVLNASQRVENPRGVDYAVTA